MNSQLQEITQNDLQQNRLSVQQEALQSLESGKVLFLPEHCPAAINVDKRAFLEPDILDGKHKNLSFDAKRQKLGGMNPQLKNSSHETFLYEFMNQYVSYTQALIHTLLPFYQDAVILGRTSYRPAEISGRPSSKRKDDTRLHVDAFPATPVNGKRILRVFTNINFDGKERRWNIGEAFPQVLEKFYPQIPPYRQSIARLMYLLKATKTLRSAYDHLMIQLHDRMKLNDTYQQNVTKTPVLFPAMSTWIVFTDQVSHAALGGQYLLEQTFYLPVEAMAKPEYSPLHQIKAKQSAIEQS